MLVMQIYTDQLARAISLPLYPKRIISLVPSQTELLFELGLDTEIVGITKFCIHPKEKYKGVTKIGGTKQINIAKIRDLKPDLIIGNKEENEKSQIEILMQEFPVWMSCIDNLNDALSMIFQVGEMVGKNYEANVLIKKLSESFGELSLEVESRKLIPSNKKLKVAYFIWKNPYMAAGKNTFIDNMLHIAGWENAFNLDRYPEVDTMDLIQASPDVILLSSEPYPFNESHLLEFKKICPDAQIFVVDGELFSWYGSRLKHTPAYLQKLIKEFSII